MAKSEDEYAATEVALSRAVSLYVRQNGHYVGGGSSAGYYTLDIPIGDDDEYYPYAFTVKNGVLSMSVMAVKKA